MVGEGVEIDAESVWARARAVIVAIPPNLTGAIGFRPALPAWRLRMGKALSQGSIIQVLAVYEAVLAPGGVCRARASRTSWCASCTTTRRRPGRWAS